MYKVPADVNEKEKVVGGLITSAQAGWLAVGFLIAIGLVLILSKVLPPIIALIIALPIGLGIGIPFAFYKKEGLSLIEYLVLSRAFKKKNKFLVNTLTYNKKVRDFFN